MLFKSLFVSLTSKSNNSNYSIASGDADSDLGPTLLPGVSDRHNILVAWTQTRNQKIRGLLEGQMDLLTFSWSSCGVLPCKARRNSFTILSLISILKIGVLHP